MPKQKKPKVSDPLAHVTVCCILAHEPDDADALRVARRHQIILPNRKYVARYRRAWAGEIERLRDHPLSTKFRKGLRSVSARLLGLEQIAATLEKMMGRAEEEFEAGIAANYTEFSGLASRYLSFISIIADEAEREKKDLADLPGAVPEEMDIDLEDALNHGGPVDPDSQLHLRDAIRRAAAATATTFPSVERQGPLVASPRD